MDPYGHDPFPPNYSPYGLYPPSFPAYGYTAQHHQSRHRRFEHHHDVPGVEIFEHRDEEILNGLDHDRGDQKDKKPWLNSQCSLEGFNTELLNVHQAHYDEYRFGKEIKLSHRQDSNVGPIQPHNRFTWLHAQATCVSPISALKSLVSSCPIISTMLKARIHQELESLEVAERQRIFCPDIRVYSPPRSDRRDMARLIPVHYVDMDRDDPKTPPWQSDMAEETILERLHGYVVGSDRESEQVVRKVLHNRGNSCLRVHKLFILLIGDDILVTCSSSLSPQSLREGLVLVEPIELTDSRCVKVTKKDPERGVDSTYSVTFTSSCSFVNFLREVSVSTSVNMEGGKHSLVTRHGKTLTSKLWLELIRNGKVEEEAFTLVRAPDPISRNTDPRYMYIPNSTGGNAAAEKRRHKQYPSRPTSGPRPIDTRKRPSRLSGTFNSETGYKMLPHTLLPQPANRRSHYFPEAYHALETTDIPPAQRVSLPEPEPSPSRPLGKLAVASGSPAVPSAPPPATSIMTAENMFTTRARLPPRFLPPESRVRSTRHPHSFGGPVPNPRLHPSLGAPNRLPVGFLGSKTNGSPSSPSHTGLNAINSPDNGETTSEPDHCKKKKLELEETHHGRNSFPRESRSPSSEQAVPDNDISADHDRYDINGKLGSHKETSFTAPGPSSEDFATQYALNRMEDGYSGDDESPNSTSSSGMKLSRKLGHEMGATHSEPPQSETDNSQNAWISSGLERLHLGFNTSENCLPRAVQQEYEEVQREEHFHEVGIQDADFHTRIINEQFSMGDDPAVTHQVAVTEPTSSDFEVNKPSVDILGSLKQSLRAEFLDQQGRETGSSSLDRSQLKSTATKSHVHSNESLSEWETTSGSQSKPMVPDPPCIGADPEAERAMSALGSSQSSVSPTRQAKLREWVGQTGARLRARKDIVEESEYYNSNHPQGPRRFPRGTAAYVEDHWSSDVDDASVSPEILTTPSDQASESSGSDESRVFARYGGSRLSSQEGRLQDTASRFSTRRHQFPPDKAYRNYYIPSESGGPDLGPDLYHQLSPNRYENRYHERWYYTGSDDSEGWDESESDGTEIEMKSKPSRVAGLLGFRDPEPVPFFTWRVPRAIAAGGRGETEEEQEKQSTTRMLEHIREFLTTDKYAAVFEKEGFKCTLTAVQKRHSVMLEEKEEKEYLSSFSCCQTVKSMVNQAEKVLSCFTPKDSTSEENPVCQWYWGVVDEIVRTLRLLTEAEVDECSEWEIRDQKFNNQDELCQDCDTDKKYDSLELAIQHIHEKHNGCPKASVGCELANDPCLAWIHGVGYSTLTESNEAFVRHAQKLVRNMSWLMKRINDIQRLIASPEDKPDLASPHGFRQPLLPRSIVSAFEEILHFLLFTSKTLTWIHKSRTDMAADAQSEQSYEKRTFYDRKEEKWMSKATDAFEKVKAHLESTMRAVKISGAGARDIESPGTLEVGAPFLALALIAKVQNTHIPTSDSHDEQPLDVYKNYMSELHYRAYRRPQRRLFAELYAYSEELAGIRVVTDTQRQALAAFEALLSDLKARENPTSWKSSHDTNATTGESIYLKRQVERLEQRQAEIAALDNKSGALREQVRQMVDILEEGHGRAIRVFTIVTLFFLPLSFVTSFMGMNTTDIRDTPSDQRIFWAAAIPLTTLTLGLAFAYGYRSDQIGDWFKSGMPRRDYTRDVPVDKLRLRGLFKNTNEKYEWSSRAEMRDPEIRPARYDRADTGFSDMSLADILNNDSQSVGRPTGLRQRSEGVEEKVKGYGLRAIISRTSRNSRHSRGI